MNFVPQILCELEEAHALGFQRAGIPVLSLEAAETPQVFKATAVAYGPSVRLYVFESRRWLVTKNLNTVAALIPGAFFQFRSQKLPQEIPAFQSYAHVWNLGVCDSTHEVFDKAKALMLGLCRAFREENPEPILDVPASKGTYQVWLPCTLQQAFEEDFEKLCHQYAETYSIDVDWKFKETTK